MAGFEKLREAVERYVPIVDSYITGDLVHGDPEYVYQAALHLIRAGGKRLRPMIVLATARALGGVEAEHRAVPLAAAVEVFHTFTLIHDDIMDRDEFRRGVPTVHVKWGEATAILAGDLLHSLAYRAILDSSRRGLEADDIVEALDALVEAAVRVSRGQAYDMMFEQKLVSHHDYLNMIYLKTGALVEASARLGALAAGAEREIVEAMGTYGRLVGVAFQIRDDVIGVFGDPRVTGKPVYSDLRRGKKTILLLYALSKAEGEDKRLLERVASGSNLSEEDLARAAEAIKATGAVDYAMSLARRYASAALSILDDVVENTGAAVDEWGVEVLRELAVFSVEREK